VRPYGEARSAPSCAKKWLATTCASTHQQPAAAAIADGEPPLDAEAAEMLEERACVSSSSLMCVKPTRDGHVRDTSYLSVTVA